MPRSGGDHRRAPERLPPRIEHAVPVARCPAQSVYSRLAGYEVNDAARLSADPTFRLIGSPKRWDRSAALTSTLHWFETELLTREKHLLGLMASNRDLLAQTEFQDHPDRVVLDMDSSESLVHGQQERGRAFLGARSRSRGCTTSTFS